MKRIFTLFMVCTVIVLSSTCFNGCGEDTINNMVNPPLFGGYETNEAGVMMTLAALSYTAETSTNPNVIRDSLIIQLANNNYATGGRWKLAWGPGVSPSGGNLMYAAVDSTSDTLYYALCVRGTVWEFPTNIQQDMEVWKLQKYPYGGTSDSVAYGSMLGLDTLLSTTDPVSGQTIQSFLSGLNNAKQKMFVTGHSLGAGLATLLSAWFTDVGYTNKFKLEVYTFASPTVGNASFVSHFHNIMLSAGAQSHRVVNSRDVVPYGWAGLDAVARDNIPTTVPVEIQVALVSIQDYLNTNGIIYKHVETKVDIGTLAPQNCTGSPGTLENYLCWVEFEHTTNTYLKLLGADTVSN